MISCSNLTYERQPRINKLDPQIDRASRATNWWSNSDCAQLVPQSKHQLQIDEVKPHKLEK